LIKIKNLRQRAQGLNLLRTKRRKQEKYQEELKQPLKQPLHFKGKSQIADYNLTAAKPENRATKWHRHGALRDISF